MAEIQETLFSGHGSESCSEVEDDGRKLNSKLRGPLFSGDDTCSHSEVEDEGGQLNSDTHTHTFPDLLKYGPS